MVGGGLVRRCGLSMKGASCDICLVLVIEGYSKKKITTSEGPGKVVREIAQFKKN